MSSRMNFATIIGTITPINNSAFNAISFKADTTWDESSILAEPALGKPRGRRFISMDGSSSTTIHNYSKAGTRDFIMFDTEAAEKLMKYYSNNPTVHFDFDFQYQLEEQDDSKIRIQRHKDVFIANQPAREVSNDVAIIRFSLDYLLLDTINAVTGEVVG